MFNTDNKAVGKNGDEEGKKEKKRNSRGKKKNRNT